MLVMLIVVNFLLFLLVAAGYFELMFTEKRLRRLEKLTDELDQALAKLERVVHG